jgi:hypothetical protein
MADRKPVTPKRNRMPADPMNPASDAKSRPCETCPFRESNLGRVTGQGERWDTYFTAETQTAVWVGTWDPDDPSSALGNGGLNHCHVTHAHACAGALAMHHRELLRFIDGGTSALTERGLERVALRLCDEHSDRLPWPKGPATSTGSVVTLPDKTRELAARMTAAARGPAALRRLRELDRDELLDVLHPGVRDPGIRSPCVAPPTPQEVEDWNGEPNSQH